MRTQTFLLLGILGIFLICSIFGCGKESPTPGQVADFWNANRSTVEKNVRGGKQIVIPLNPDERLLQGSKYSPTEKGLIGDGSYFSSDRVPTSEWGLYWKNKEGKWVYVICMFKLIDLFNKGPLLSSGSFLYDNREWTAILKTQSQDTLFLSERNYETRVLNPEEQDYYKVLWEIKVKGLFLIN